MNNNFSERMRTVLEYVQEEAIRLGDETIGVEHLILGIIREGNGSAIQVLNNLGLEMKDVRQIIEEVVSINDKKTLGYNTKDSQITKQAKNILDKSLMEIQSLGDKNIKTIHVLLSILKDKNNIVYSTFNQLNIDYDKVLRTYISIQEKSSVFASGL